ncbi:MAG: thiolase family protein [Oligoflexales bacterium]|nr:thiolase family protein [Oligoflexales bacterium]
MNNNPTVIVYAKRTAIGKFCGGLSTTPAPMLGATLVKDVLKQGLVSGQEINEIIMGNVLPAGIGQAPARQTAIYGGLPESVCAMTINKVCGSGLKAVMLADQAIRLGDAKIVLAGGQENMSLAPHLLLNSRSGFRFGPSELKDHMQWDGLWDPYGNSAMGNFGEVCAKEYKFSREEQDDFAIESYQRARAAQATGHFAKEIIAVEVASKKQINSINIDEEPAGADLERLRQLNPAFEKNGTITAANASSINDGAAILLLMDLATAKAKGLKPLAKITAQASFAQSPQWFTTAPIGAIKKVLDVAKLKKSDIDLFEINEAFSAVTMAAMKDLGLDHKKVNAFGGAVALGHPIGASGARILVTLINGLLEKNGRYGLATLCIGGGEASAVVIENCHIS